MNEQELLGLFFGRFDAFQTLWNLYLTVILGLLAFVVSVEKAARSRFVKTMISLGFAAFALSNLYALLGVRAQRVHLAEALLLNCGDQVPGYLQGILKAGMPAESINLAVFHLAFDLGLIGLIWLAPRIRAAVRRRRKGTGGTTGVPPGES